jgi:protein PhnA
MSLPKCPKCSSIYVYEDGNLLVCPECAYEFSANDLDEQARIIMLSFGCGKGSRFICSFLKIST